MRTLLISIMLLCMVGVYIGAAMFVFPDPFVRILNRFSWGRRWLNG